ncbi:hypothetical protein B0H16DRAFT_1728177 [Mycena metata]|uniref:Zn(2)-C6 fungal-type domain-containing protein n=1 Tax=Mycena metata TaxID=1033252 RepID=A0AAD7II65_9AGAR|nr:hypothetical protein B0H16DRAFT_1728177 [Mycena metata]
MAPKRKPAAAVPEDDPNAVELVTPDDPRAPWSAFWPSQACTDIIFYFDTDHIENSEAQVVMPIINTLHVIMADFFSRYPEFPWDVAAYVASLTAAVEYLLHKHLPVECIPDYQDMLWEIPADIARQLKAPHVFIRDFLSPMLWEDLPIGCVSCDNRGIPCKLSPGNPRCKPCKKGGGKCLRASNGPEQLTLLDRLRPFMAQSPDMFINAIVQALHTRCNAEMHFLLLAHAMESLHLANDKTRNQFFEDPDDRVHIENLVHRGLEKKSFEQHQLEHL